jgi:hypothetical protein
VGKTNFSKKALEKLPPKDKWYNVFDSQRTGLGRTVYPTGVKTFFDLRKVQGWPERTTLGQFPELTVENANGPPCKDMRSFEHAQLLRRCSTNLEGTA